MDGEFNTATGERWNLKTDTGQEIEILDDGFAKADWEKLAEAIHAVRGLRAAMHGFVMLETTGQFQLAEDSADSYRWLVDTVIRGLEAPPITGP